MKHERIQPPRRTHDEVVISSRFDELARHNQALRDFGYDPEFIGVTEVKPVTCTGCGKAIPWAALRGWEGRKVCCAGCGKEVPGYVLRSWQD
jgi:hypothetical protein